MATIGFFSVLLIAIGLSVDCFAVALSGSISMRTVSSLQVLRASLAFGLFQALMPVLGWLAGQTVVELIADYDHWAAFVLLALVGSRMIWKSLHSENGRSENADITKGLLLLTLSLATSMDALAVGLSFAFLHTNIALASLTIGVIAFVATVIGFLLGRKVGNLVGKRAETVGGIVLIGIGLRILSEHIL